MAEFKNMTVQALRELARKALGRGHSKLKTKEELIHALQVAERKVAGAAGKAASRVKEATGRAARATGKMARATERMVESVRGKGKAARAARAGRAAPAEGVPAAGRPSAAAGAGEVAREAVRGVAEAAKAGARKVRAAVRREPQPDPEGYMVARVAGEDALRGAPHAMTETAVEADRGAGAGAEERPEPPEAFDEQLGELPWAYADDALIALPRDPRTLFLYWDHGQDTLRSAWEGLEGGRPQIWLFAREPGGGWTRIRTVDFALESRSYYLHDLDPGRIYRAEIHLVDRRGREKMLPRGSNEMMLPPVGPSPIIDDRFMRILWGEPLQRLLREAQPGGPFPEDVRAQLARLSDWSRFAGRAWGGSSAGSAGGMGGRPFSAVSSPSAPTSPASPWKGTDGEGR